MYRKKLRAYEQVKQHLYQYTTTQLNFKSLYWYYYVSNYKYNDIYNTILRLTNTKISIFSEQVVFYVKTTDIYDKFKYQAKPINVTVTNTQEQYVPGIMYYAEDLIGLMNEILVIFVKYFGCVRQ
jgi:hypothetical protein